MSLAPGDIPYLPRGVRLRWCDVRQGWFLLAPERAVKLDAVAAAILTAADGSRSFEQVVAKLTEDYAAPKDKIVADAGKFLADLMAKRMLECRR